MKKLFFLTTILVVFIFIPRIVFGNVIINEIMYDLEGADDGREWVEIFNNSDTAIDLNNWKFWEGGTNHKLTVFQGSAILPPNGYAIIADNPDKFLIDNSSYSGIIFDSTFSLSNDGENLILKDNNLITIDELTYSSSWGAKGNERSLQRENPTENNWGSGVSTPGALNNISPEESKQSTTEKPLVPITGDNHPPIAEAGDNIIAFINQEIKFDGTKSTDPDNNELAYSWNMGDGKLIEKPSFTYKYNYPGTYTVSLMVYDGQYYVIDTAIIKIEAGQIIINEFLPNPSGKDEEEEWIEIYNDSDFAVDISDWQLDDTASGSKPFTFPKNTLIAPKSYIVLTRQITGIALNNDKDSVRLLLPEGLVFQEINYENPPLGKSSAKTEEGFVWSESTPGTANITNLAVNEIKKISYQQAIKPETVKESNQDYAWYYQNAPQKEIGGNYENIGAPTENLAAVKEVSPQKEPTNLVLVLGFIVLGGFVIGFLLVKFRKKYHSPASFN